MRGIRRVPVAGACGFDVPCRGCLKRPPSSLCISVRPREGDCSCFASRESAYAYDVSCNAADQQYGNLSRVEERDNGSTVRVAETWYNRRNNESWTWPADYNASFSVTYLVDRPWKQQVSDAGGVVQSLSHSFYYDDALTGAARPDTNVLGKRGLLWRVSSYRNAGPCCSYPLYASDTTYSYDQYGNRTGETTYADEGRMTSATAWTAPGNGSAARTTTFEYDATFHALSTKVTYPTVNGVTLSESAGYSGSGNLGFRLGVPTSITDANGNVSSAEYEVFGRITKLIRPGDSSNAPTTQFSYYDNENPVRYRADLRENAGGVRSIQHFYDGIGRAIQTKSESSDGASSLVNVVADTRYDGLDRVVEASQPRYLVETSTSFYQYSPPTATLFNRTKTKYDALGRVVEVEHPNTTKTTTNYTLGSYGTRVRVIDPKSHQSESNYDTFGRLRSVIEYSKESGYEEYATTTYAYTSLNLLAQVTDDAANITKLYYDSLGRKTRMDDPDLGTWLYTYDALGNLKRQTDARGQRVCLFYDALSRPTGKHYNGNSDSCPASPTTVAYNYDQGSNGKGQRTAISSPDATSSWSYDARGRRTQATHTVAGVTRVFAWAYDSADRVTRISYPVVGGVTEAVDYTYDAGWRPTSACTSRGGCYVSSGATYTALSQPKRWVQGNNVVSRWTYSTYLQRLQQLQIGPSSCAGAACLFDRTYGYDNAGNVLNITDNRNAGNNQTYDYDHRDRLTSWTLSGSTQSYAYNPIGNLTTKAGHAYSYGNTLHKHAVTNDGINGYGYDANGNQTTINGATRYTWNAENMPSSIIGADGIAESYGYDGDNERVKKVRSGATTIYLEGLWEEAVGGATKVYYSFNGQPVAVREGNALSYLHGDHLGSVGCYVCGGTLQRVKLVATIAQRRLADLFDMTMIGPTAPTEHIKVLQYPEKRAMLPA
jgi:YD repeat-containing protein